MDQAEKLRKMVAEHSNVAILGRTTSFLSSRPGAGKSLIISAIAAQLVSEGKSVLVVEEVQNPMGYASIPRMLKGSIDRLCVAPFLGALSQVTLADWIGRAESHATYDNILVESKRSITGVDRQILVTTGDRFSLLEDGIFLTNEVPQLDLRSSVGVIVNQVASQTEARSQFYLLQREVRAVPQLEFDYLGAFPRIKNVSKVIAGNKNLIELRNGFSPGACAELATRRMVDWHQRLMHSRMEVGLSYGSA